MRILYIAPYKDGTGWGNAAIENILALDAAGIEVVPRAIKLNDINAEIPKRVLELEQASDKGCNIVIQNSLPHHFDYQGSFDRNIAYYFTETSHFRNSTWAERINLLDEAWVPCQTVANASIESNVKIPIKIVPVPTDISKYQRKYETFNIPYLKDKFVFYTIGEVSRRKNLVAFLKAFHLEFRPDENVAILIKGNIPGVSPNQVDEHIREICNTVKDQLKLYRRKELYHSEVIIGQRLNEEQIMQLHSTCDCYVSASYGEGWNMPAFDAMAMGKTPICTNIGGPADFLYKQTQVYTGHGGVDFDEEWGGWLVPSQPEPVFGMTNGTFDDLYVGNEEWWAINISELRKTMRKAFEDENERRLRAVCGMSIAYNYSHANVGERMKEILDGK